MTNPQDVFENLQQYWSFITLESDAKFEGQHFDRKQAGQVDCNGLASPSSIDKLQDEIVECVSAFANNEGGLVVVGISKNGEVTGVNHLNPDQLKRITTINQLLRNQSAQVKYIDCTNQQGNPDRIFLIYVPPSDGICETLTYPPRAWIRNGDRCEPLTDDMRETLKREKRIVDFEQTYCCPFDPEDIDKDVLVQFRRSYSDYDNNARNDQDFLYQLGAVRKEKNGLYFTNAGYLFFSSRPQRILSWAHVRLMRFNVNVSEFKTRGLPTFEREFEGALPQQIRKLRAYFKESGFFKTYQRRASSGGFIEEPELPTIAVDEAIVNAVAHRDYGIRLPIDCVLYKDSFVVENPGRILQRDQTVPDHFDLAQITLDSMPRNSTLIQWLKNMRGDDGKAFVQALSEGTKRMQEEMSRLKLPSPVYETSLKRTILSLFSNAEQREATFRAEAIAATSTEFTNLFRLNLTRGGQQETPKIFNKRLKEVERYLMDALEGKGWFIDRNKFGEITAHRRGAGLAVPDPVRPYIQFFPAYIFQFKIFGSQMFLCLDYTLEVKNVSNVRSLLNLCTPEDLKDRHAIAKLSDWQRGRIIRAEAETTLVHFFEPDHEEFIDSAKVIPDLPLSFIGKILEAAHVRFDLFREIKKGSLALEPNSSRLRAEKSIATAGELATTVFPLMAGDVVLSLEKTPLQLFRGKDDLLSIQSLTEPPVEFNRQQETADIRDGITRFGSYDTGHKTIELIPICIDSQRDGMASLIERLKAGKFKYAGAERTFHTRLTYNTIVTVNAQEQILDECKRLVREHPEWVGDPSLGRLFLVHTPEQGNSLDDEKSPYYAVKRFLLECGIPCQMVDTPTILNPDWKDLNLALNITAKCGVTPWVLPDRIPDADFFVGLSYTQNYSKGLRRLLGYATVFNQFGRWEFYSGNTNTFSFDQRDTFFAQLTENTLRQIAKSNSLSDRPNIYFHYSAKFSKEDIATILAAARVVRPMGIYHFVSINSHHNIRLYDSRPETDGSVSRGSYIITSPRRMILSTTGYNPYRKALGTPRPLEVTIWIEPPQGTYNTRPDMKALANQILSLTKLNWASTDSLCGEPITVKYAGDIAYLTDAFLRQSESFKLHQVLEKTPWFI